MIRNNNMAVAARMAVHHLKRGKRKSITMVLAVMAASFLRFCIFSVGITYFQMLRTQNIPVRLVIGYIQPDHLYHAWNQVYIDGEWIWKDLTFGSSSPYKEEDYKPERKY